MDLDGSAAVSLVVVFGDEPGFGEAFRARSASQVRSAAWFSRATAGVAAGRLLVLLPGSTAAVEGWRVCIVDTVDELNPNAANALLKVLEEPPLQSLFLYTQLLDDETVSP